MFKLPAIPDPQQTVESLYVTVLALKEAVENLAGVRGPTSTTAATIPDIEALRRRIIALEVELANAPNTVTARDLSLAVTELSDVAALVTIAAGMLNLVATEAKDALAVNINFVSSASLAATETKDMLAANVNFVSSASLAATEASDTVAANVNFVSSVSLAATEASDTAAANINFFSSASLAVTEAKDTGAFATDFISSVSLAATEANDAAVFNVTAANVVSFAITEAVDTAAFAAGISATTSLAATEANDAAAFNVGIRATLSFAVTETKDTAAFTTGITSTVSLAATEAKDTAAFTTTNTNLTLAATEAKDTSAINVNFVSTASFAVTEAKDAAAFNTSTASGWAGTYVTGKRRSLVFIGDSITWGYNVSQNDSYVRKIQNAINTTRGHTDAGWVARNIHSDDYSTTPFNGGLSGVPKLEAAGVLQGPDGGPFSYYAGNKGGSYTDPIIRFNDINDNIALNCSGATYFVAVLKGVGTSGSANVTAYSDSGYSNTQTITPGQTLRVVFGSFSAATRVSLWLTARSGDATVDVLTIHPTTLYPTTFVNVQVNARNSHAIADYTSATSSIRSTIIHLPAELEANPVYVLAVGTVSIYDSGRDSSSSPRPTPTQYVTQLDTLVNGLKTAAGTNGGTVVLTVPPVPTGTYTAPSGYTHGDYKAAILNYANTNSLFCVDLSGVLSAGDYLDNLHPTPAGHTKLANKYISDLQL